MKHVNQCDETDRLMPCPDLCPKQRLSSDRLPPAAGTPVVACGIHESDGICNYPIAKSDEAAGYDEITC
jgi:hypothetical protein